MPILSREVRVQPRTRNQFSDYELSDERVFIYDTLLGNTALTSGNLTAEQVARATGIDIATLCEYLIDGRFENQTFVLLNPERQRIAISGAGVQLTPKVASGLRALTQLDRDDLKVLVKEQYKTKNDLIRANGLITLLDDVITRNQAISGSVTIPNLVTANPKFSRLQFAEAIIDNKVNRANSYLRDPEDKDIVINNAYVVVNRDLAQVLPLLREEDKTALKAYARERYSLTQDIIQTRELMGIIKPFADGKTILAVSGGSAQSIEQVATSAGITSEQLVRSLFSPANIDSANCLLNDEKKRIGVNSAAIVVNTAFVSSIRALAREDRDELLPIILALYNPDNNSITKQQIKSALAFDAMMLSSAPADMQSDIAKDALAFCKRLKIREEGTEITSRIIDRKATPAQLLACITALPSAETPRDAQVRAKLLSLYDTSRVLDTIIRSATALESGSVQDAIEEVRELLAGDTRKPALRTTLSALSSWLYEIDVATLNQNVVKMLQAGSSFEDVERLISSKKQYPTEGAFDYSARKRELRDNARRLYRASCARIAREKIKSFNANKVRSIIDSILALPSALESDEDLKVELLNRFKVFLTKADNDNATREIELVNEALARVEAPQRKNLFKREILGANREASTFINRNYFRVLHPLFKALRAFPNETITKNIIGRDAMQDESISKKYVQSVMRFVEQLKKRGETLPEFLRIYIESVERLSKINPYLLALAREDSAIVDEYLRAHFDKEATAIWRTLQNGASVKSLFVGSGSNGLSAIAEAVRLRPRLVKQTLVIDQARYPGGPFASPLGDAFQMNSKNAERELTIPNTQDLAETTLQGYRVSGLPGQRVEGGPSLRPSIDKPAAWGIAPDYFSDKLYPSNAEMQRTIALMFAVVSQNQLMRTRLTRLRKSEGDKGLYTVTLEHTSNGVKETKSVESDFIVLTTGLGEPYYGYDLKNTRTEQILNKQATPELMRASERGGKYIAHTSEFLEEISSERSERITLPEVMVLAGDGNSTAIELEKIYGLLKGGAKNGNVKKVYVIGSEADLIARPRYKAISDLFRRANKEGEEQLVEIIEGRASDVNVVTVDGEKKVVLYLNNSQKPYELPDGTTLYFDKYLPNTGYRGSINDLVRDLSGDATIDIFDERSTAVKPITLPTNSEIVVGLELTNFPGIIIEGVGAGLEFGAGFLESLPSTVADKFSVLAEVNSDSIGVNSLVVQGAMETILSGSTVVDGPAVRDAFVQQTVSVVADTSSESFDSTKEVARKGTKVTEDFATSKQTFDGVSREVRDTNKMLSTLLAQELSDVVASGAYSGEIVIGANVLANDQLEVTLKRATSSVSTDFLKFVARKLAGSERFMQYLTNGIMLVPDDENYEGAVISFSFENGVFTPRKKTSDRGQRGYVRI